MVALAWIELHQTMPSHRKTLRVARKLQVTRFEAVGILCALWCWALDNATTEGKITGADAQDISDAIQYNGPAEKLLGALIDSGYIEQNGGGFILHDWHDYAGRLMDKRKSDAERKRASRLVQRNVGGRPADVQWTESGNSCDGVGTLPYPTSPFNILACSVDEKQDVGVEEGSNSKLIGVIVEYLNQRTGSLFRATTATTQKLINARLADGYILDDFIRVIDDRCLRWRGTDQEQYLRPTTLFRPSNFESYVNAIPKQEEKRYFQSDIDVFGGNAYK